MTTTEPETRHSPKGEPPPPGGPPRRTPAREHHRIASLIDLSVRLSTRDLTLALLLADHKTLSTEQITQMLYGSTRTCLNRLRLLRHLDFITRFRPVTPTRHAAWHWIAGTMSTRYVALARAERPPTPKQLAQRQDAIMASPQLAHLAGTNTFFTTLIAHSRAHPDTRLTRWWPTPTTAAAFARRIHPDGHGVWRDGGREVGWFLEMDTGTEDHGRLVAKLEAYRRLREDGGPDYPLLFWLPTRLRETHLHQRITPAHRAGLTVATAARDNLHGHSPAGPIWRLAGHPPLRLSLVELPSHHGDPGPYVPGAPTPEQDPLHLIVPSAP